MSLLATISIFEPKKPLFYPKRTSVINDDIVMTRNTNHKMRDLHRERDVGGNNIVES